MAISLSRSDHCRSLTFFVRRQRSRHQVVDRSNGMSAIADKGPDFSAHEKVARTKFERLMVLLVQRAVRNFCVVRLQKNCGANQRGSMSSWSTKQTHRIVEQFWQDGLVRCPDDNAPLKLKIHKLHGGDYELHAACRVCGKQKEFRRGDDPHWNRFRAVDNRRSPRPDGIDGENRRIALSSVRHANRLAGSTR